MRPRPVLVAMAVLLAHQLHTTAAEPPSNYSASSTTVNSIESSTVPTDLGNAKEIGKGAGGGQQDLKPYLEPPGRGNQKRRPFWRRPRRPPQRPRHEQQSYSQPQPTPTPDPAAFTNFLAAAAFLLQNQQQLQANKFNNQPPANSISPTQQPQPFVGPFTYTQMSNVYKDGQPIPSQVFSTFSGPSSTAPFSSPSGHGSSFGGRGPSAPSSFGPSGFSVGAGRTAGHGFQTHYTNPNTSPYQPSSIATSFFSRPPPQSSSAPSSSQSDYEIAKSHYHPATVLPSAPSPTGPQSSRVLSNSGPTAASNLAPQSYALEVTSKIQTDPNTATAPSAPGSIQYITPTPHKPYAVIFEPGSKLLGSQMLNTNQLLSESEHFFKLFNKNAKNVVGGLPPDQFLKTVSFTGASGPGRVVAPLSYSSSKFNKQAPSILTSPSYSSRPLSQSPSATSISNLEEKMNLLLNLVPHLVKSGALPADSLLAPALDTSKYVLPTGTDSLRPSPTAQDLRYLKQQYLLAATAPSKTPSLSSLEPHESAYYSPSSSSKLPAASPLIIASPSYIDLDSPYDLIANPSASGSTVIKGEPSPSSSVEVSDPVIVYHHSSSSSSSPYSSMPVSSSPHHHHHSSMSSAGYHPFAAPSSSSLLSSLNEDRPRSPIGSLLSSVRKLIF